MLVPAILGLSVAWAAVVGSGVLMVASWIGGDIAYHRGVGYTMQGASWQGEGPYLGLLSYYGGLYPLVVGRASAFLDQPFDAVLSEASWGVALVWPLAFWWLGRRVWRDDQLRPALLALLATTAAPFTNRALLWVESPLVAAQNTFPVYPRDLAILLLIGMAGSVLAATGRTRVLGAGLAIGGIVVFHLQIALLAGWLLVATSVVAAVARRERGPMLEMVSAGVIALVVSAWWWVPRVVATIQSGGLLLGGFPGAPPFRLDAGNALMAFGIVGVMALLGMAVAASGRRLPGRLGIFAVWMLALVPLVLLDRMVGGSDFVSERRTWLLISIPLTVFAAATASLIAARLRPAALGAFILLLVLPSVPGTVATMRLVREAWEPGRIGGRTFDTSRWDPLITDLNDRVQAEGGHVVVTYDGYAAWVWSLSGAQVPSLWLPGPFKLGFDPEVMTGVGHMDRLRAHEAAFAGGRDGICGLAVSSGGGSVVLDVEDGLVGTFDESPASAFRADPQERSDLPIERLVAPGVTYVDRRSQDVLLLAPGARWQPRFRSPSARRLAVEINVPLPEPGQPAATAAGPLIIAHTADGQVAFGQGLMPGPARVVVPVAGVDDRVAVEALEAVDLVRFTAFEELPDLALPDGDGPVRWSTNALCGVP